MKTRIQTISLMLTLAFSAAAQEKKESASKPLSAGNGVLISVTADVESIDLDKREVTLKGPLGNAVTFVVDKRVQRLDQVKAGDHVSADYYVSIAAEVRLPTAEEKAGPITVLDELADAPAGTEPAGGGLHQIKIVTTVEGLDVPTQTVTLKGPRGNSVMIRVQNPDNLKKLRLGDTIVVTYTEALAVSLEKVPAKKG